MSAHDRFRELLARRAELSDGEETSLRAHLQDCSECRRVAVAFEQDAALLRSLARPEPPEEIRRTVRARLRQPHEP